MERGYGFFQQKRVLLLFSLFYILVHYLWLGISTGSSLIGFIGNAICTYAGVLVASGVIFQNYRTATGVDRRFWRLIFAGIISYNIAELISGYYLVVKGIIAPMPNLADLFYLLLPISFIAALTSVIWCRNSAYEGMRHIFDVLLIMVAAASVSWKYMINPIMQMYDQKMITTLLAAVFPIFDMGLLYSIIKVYYLTELSCKHVLRLMVLGVIVFVFSDMFFLLAHCKMKLS